MRTYFFVLLPSPSLWEGPRDFGLPKSSGGCCLCQRHRQRAKATRFTYYMYFFNVQNKSLLFFKFVNKKRYKKKSKKFLALLKFFLPVYISFIFPRTLKQFDLIFTNIKSFRVHICFSFIYKGDFF